MSTYFAYNLKYLREKRGWSQDELATCLNVARSTISCWENGIRIPKIDKIMEIAKIFNIKQDIIGTDIRTPILENENDFLLKQLEQKFGVKITIQKNAPLTKKAIDTILRLLYSELNR